MTCSVCLLDCAITVTRVVVVFGKPREHVICVPCALREAAERARWA